MAGLVLARKERKEVLREEAIERNNGYQNQISTSTGTQQYITMTPNIGTKQLFKLNALLRSFKNHNK